MHKPSLAFFQGGEVVAQQWLFWVAPILGAVIAGLTYAAITGVDRSNINVEG